MDLTTYVATAILAWTAVKGTPTTEVETVRLRSVAFDVVAVVGDPNEQPLFPGDVSKAETAIQVASVGFFESRFWTFVDDGKCNDRAWRLATPGRHDFCDGGQAFSFWQIHDGYSTKHGWAHGIALDGDGWKNGPDGLKGSDLLADRKLAARLALHMLRSSLKTSGTLCGYTGEPKGSGCPKAKQRRDHARAYVVAHPFAASP